MNIVFDNSICFGIFLTTGAYFLGLNVKKRWKLAIFNPLLMAILFVMVFLKITDIHYEFYQQNTQILSSLLTPATVCLAIPLYKQIHMLRKYRAAVAVGITSGVMANAVSVFLLCRICKLNHEHYVTLLPKSITTAIGLGLSSEIGGITTLTVVCIIVTGIIGSMCAELFCRLFRITHPIAKGLAIGTCSHAIGTTKALEMGEIEGAMSSLSIAVAGLMTVIVVPMAAGWL
ncbi:MAG: LrgB family protein [Lachnospiraceae bacterium]|nr:LrgB family protein [Lachnospiraceae bacterium]